MVPLTATQMTEPPIIGCVRLTFFGGKVIIFIVED